MARYCGESGGTILAACFARADGNVFQTVHIRPAFHLRYGGVGPLLPTAADVLPPDAMLDVAGEDVVDDLRRSERLMVEYCGLHRGQRRPGPGTSVPQFASTLAQVRKRHSSVGAGVRRQHISRRPTNLPLSVFPTFSQSGRPPRPQIRRQCPVTTIPRSSEPGFPLRDRRPARHCRIRRPER